jgi:tRNA-splicing ligase RtcB
MRPDITARIDATNKPYKLYTDVIEDSALVQFAECLEQPSVVQGALMPDTHTGYVAPIGSVLATEGTIFPSFVGYDIGCGMSEAMMDVKATEVTVDQLEKIKEEILKRVPIGFTRHKKQQPVPKEILKMPMTDYAKKVFKEQGGSQIGTLGGGNHFLEIGRTNDGHLSVVIHSGSRGVGHKIATHHMKQAAIENTDQERYIKEFNENPKNVAWYNSFKNGRVDSEGYKIQLKKFNEAREEFVYRRVRARVDNIEDGYPLDVTTKAGQDYINDMNAALEFALANRKTMIQAVQDAVDTVLGTTTKQLRFINKNHNHADLRDGLWIHRKGATQAEDGMMGVIPGNMVDGSFIVQGKGNADSLYSSSHGAGRVLSRRQAKETLSVEEFNESTKHLVANHSDKNVDEAPKAYKSIFEVMDNQKDLIEVLDRVIPVLNIKG